MLAFLVCRLRRSGWPDVDMIGGRWDVAEERAHLSIIAVIGSPLLLSFDPRSNASSTLGLAAYLNAELIAIHQDNASGVTHDGRYYARVSGGETTGPDATRVVFVDCAAPEAVWTWRPSNSSARPAPHSAGRGGGYGQLEASGGLPGYCLVRGGQQPPRRFSSLPSPHMSRVVAGALGRVDWRLH